MGIIGLRRPIWGCLKMPFLPPFCHARGTPLLAQCLIHGICGGTDNGILQVMGAGTGRILPVMSPLAGSVCRDRQMWTWLHSTTMEQTGSWRYTPWYQGSGLRFMVSHGTQRQIGTGGYRPVLSHRGMVAVAISMRVCARYERTGRILQWCDGDMACAGGHGFWEVPTKRKEQ